MLHESRLWLVQGTASAVILRAAVLERRKVQNWSLFKYHLLQAQKWPMLEISEVSTLVTDDIVKTELVNKALLQFLQLRLALRNPRPRK